MARALVLALVMASPTGASSQAPRWTTPGCWVATPGTFAPVIKDGVVSDLPVAQRGCGLMDACNAVTCITDPERGPGPQDCTPRRAPGLRASAEGEITYEQVCRDGQSPLPPRVCWSGTAGVFPHPYVIPYALNLTSGVEDRARYSLADALPRCLALQGGCGAVACDSGPQVLPPSPNQAAQCTLRREATSENTTEPAPVKCKISTSNVDDGYPDEFRGWYDVQGCGHCLDYCRWVGDSGPGGDPAARLEFGTSWWSCRLAGKQDEPYSLNGTFSSWPYLRCSERFGVSDAVHPSTFEATYFYLCDAPEV